MLPNKMIAKKLIKIICVDDKFFIIFISYLDFNILTYKSILPYK